MGDGLVEPKLSIPDFAKRIREKEGAYDDLDDYDLVEAVVRKHPVYADRVELPKEFSLLGGVTSGHKKIDELYERKGRQYGVDPRLLLEQGRQETVNFNPDVWYGRRGSPKNAQGSGQFIPGTAKRFNVDINDPESGVDGQARYMRELLDMFDNDEELALAGYNAGEHRKSLRQGKIPPFKETQDYVKKIRGKVGEYRSTRRGDLRSLLQQAQQQSSVDGAIPNSPLDVGVPAYGQGSDPQTQAAIETIAAATETPAGRVLANTVASQVGQAVQQQQAAQQAQQVQQQPVAVQPQPAAVAQPATAPATDEGRDIDPNEVIDKVYYSQGKPDDVSTEDWIRQDVATYLQEKYQIPFNVTERYLKAKGVAALQGDRNLSEEDLQAAYKRGDQFFGITTTDLDNLNQIQEDITARETQAETDYQVRLAQLDPNLAPEDRQLEELRLRGLADVDAGLRSSEEVTAQYEREKAALDAWKQSHTIDPNATISAEFQVDPAKQAVYETDQRARYEAERQQAIKQHGSLPAWLESQQADRKRFEKTPFLAIAKTMEAAAGGVLKAPIEGAASVLESIAIGSEAVERATGGLPGDPDAPDAEKKATFKLARELRDIAKGVEQKIDPAFRGGTAEMFGNVAGQVIVQAALGIATGGAAAPTLFGAAQGAAGQYEEAKGAAPWHRLGAAVAGAAFAAPDYFIFRGMQGGKSLLGSSKHLAALKSSIQSGLEKAGVAGAEAAAIDATDGFLARLISEGGWKARAAQVAKTAGRQIKIGAAEGGQEVSETYLNHFYAYLTYDHSQERLQKIKDAGGQALTEGSGGFFGGLLGATISDAHARAAELDDADLKQVQQVAAEIPEFDAEIQKVIDAEIEKRQAAPGKATATEKPAVTEKPTETAPEKVTVPYRGGRAEGTIVSRDGTKVEVQLDSGGTITVNDVRGRVQPVGPAPEILSPAEKQARGEAFTEEDFDREFAEPLRNVTEKQPYIEEAGEDNWYVYDAEDHVVARFDSEIEARDYLKENSAPLRSVADTKPATPAPTFYSHLERTIESKMPNKATADQIKGIIKDTKQEERDWLDIDGFLRDNPNPTKQELLDFVRANNAQVEEVEKGGIDSAQAFAEAEQWWNDEGGANEETPWDDLSPDEQIDAVQRYRDEVLEYSEENLDNGTKFSQYTLPGGENYRELLLTMPSSRWEGVNAETGRSRFFNTRSEAESFAGPDGAVVPASESEYANSADSDPVVFKSSHYDEPNVLAHVRFDTRDGGKTLHIAEIQSDWHQAGRKRGYTDPVEAKQKEADAARDAEIRNRLVEVNAAYDRAIRRAVDAVQSKNDAEAKRFAEEAGKLQDEKKALIAESQEISQRTYQTNSTVPDAPFKKSWHELAMKRMLRYAAENGFERVTWDTGETQADRYDLSKQVDSIKVAVVTGEPGRYLVDLKPTKGDTIRFNVSDGKVENGEWKGKLLEDVVGKDVAEKILQVPEGKIQTLAGNDLKVGGEGMKGFYDQILPASVNKYVKKWGGKVEADQIRTEGNVPTDVDFAAFAKRQNPDITAEEIEAAWQHETELFEEYNESLNNASVHSLAITPAMRESVMQGQPLYKARTPESAEEHLQMQNLTTGQVLKAGIEANSTRNGLEVSSAAMELLRRMELVYAKRDVPVTDGMFINPKQAKQLIAYLNNFTGKYADKFPAAVNRQLANLSRKMSQIAKRGKIVYVFDEAVGHEKLHKLSFMAAGGKNLIERHKNILELARQNAALIQKAHAAHYEGYGYALPDLDSDTFTPSEMVQIAVIVEEMAVSSMDGDYARIGLTSREAAEYVKNWLDSYVAVNGEQAAQRFADLIGSLERSDETVLDAVRERLNEDQETEEVPGIQTAAESPVEGPQETDTERAGRVPEGPETAPRAADREPSAAVGEERERATVRSAEAAGVVKDVPAQLRYYNQKSKDVAVRQAQERIEQIGLAAAYHEALTSATEGRRAEHTAFQMELAKLLNRQADAATQAGRLDVAKAKLGVAQEIVGKIAESGTDYGQAISQLSEWQKTDPDAVTGYVQKRRSQIGYAAPLTPDQATGVRSQAQEVADLQAEVNDLRTQLEKFEAEQKGEAPAPRKRSDKNPNIARLEKEKQNIIQRLLNNPLRMVTPAQSPGLQKFLEGSVVQDVVYHATKNDFEVADLDKTELGLHLGTAEQSSSIGEKEGGRLMPVYLRLINPYRVSFDSPSWGGSDMEWVFDSFDDPVSADFRFAKTLAEKNAALRKYLQSKGHDGIVYPNTHEGVRLAKTGELLSAERMDELDIYSGDIQEDLDRQGGEYIVSDSYIVFDPKQIKSATGNQGTFDPNDPNILRQVSQLGAAPMREGQITDLNAIDDAFDGKEFVAFDALATDLANELGLDLKSQQNTIGIWSNTSSLPEVSLLPVVEGKDEDIELYAALLGTLAPEAQDSVMSLTYDENGTGRKYEIKFDSPESAKDAINRRSDFGMSDLSYEPATNTVILVESGPKDLTALESTYGDRIQSIDEYNVNARFIGEGEYGSILEDRKQNERTSGPVRARIQTALKRLTSAAEPEGLPERSGVSGSEIVLADPYGANQGTSLKGAPGPIDIEGRRIQFGGYKPAQDVARSYMQRVGLPYVPNEEYVPLDKERAIRIADEFEKMEHKPDDPEVLAAYNAMIAETAEQFREILKTGLKIEFIDYAKTGDPYHASPRLAQLDVIENNHLWVFSTRDGFGSDETFDASSSPLLQPTEFEISGQPALANDLFRVVHDYFGHIKDGVGFRARGEENAWVSHSRMYSPLARRAMTSETRGQNSWVNFGPHGDFNRTASGGDTIYADQKLGLMPHWVSETEEEAEEPLRRVSDKQTTSTVSLMQDPEQAKKDLGLKEKNSVREIGEALQKRTEDAGLAIERDDRSDAARRRIATGLADETRYQLGTSALTGTGLGWYSTNFPNALAELGKIYPEFKQKNGAKELFTAVLAVTSNGERVSQNLSNAMEVYDQIRRGVSPTKISLGTKRVEAFEGNMASLERLLKEFGPKGMVPELMREMTVREIEAKLSAAGEKVVTGYAKDAVMPVAALYFGPKLGAFYANLMGSEGYLTMDLWWSRTFNRHRGQLVPEPTETSIQNLRTILGLKEATDDDIIQLTPDLESAYRRRSHKTELEELMGRKEGRNTEEKEAFWKQVEAQIPIRRRKQLERQHRAEKAANTIYKDAFKELVEAPYGPGDRTFMGETAHAVQDLFATQGVQLSIADIQAALWYYEKRLYVALGKKGTTDDIGYEEAIRSTATGDRARRPTAFFDRQAHRRSKAEAVQSTRFDDEAAEAPLRSVSPQTQTPEFKKWFGDSKVVDENGEPLRVVHGSSVDTGDVFQHSLKGQNTEASNTILGFFFTDSPELAEARYAGAPQANLTDVYLKIERPLRLKDEYEIDPGTAIRENAREYLDHYPETDEDWQDYADYVHGRYDGIIFKYGEGRFEQNTYVAFEPTQIKSAIGNRGTFDPTDPSILRSVTPDEKELLADYAAVRILEDRTHKEVIEDLKSVAPRATADEIAEAHLAAWDMLYPQDSDAKMSERAKIRLEHYKEVQKTKRKLTQKVKKEIDPEFKEKNPKAGPRRGQFDPEQNQNIRKEIDPEFKEKNPKAGPTPKEFDPRASQNLQQQARTIRMVEIGTEEGLGSHELHAAVLLQRGDTRTADETAQELMDLYGLSSGDAINAASKGAQFRQKANKQIDEEGRERQKKIDELKGKLPQAVKKANTAQRELLNRIKGLEKPPPSYSARIARIYKAALVSAVQTSVNNLLTAQATRKLLTLTDLVELALNKGLAKAGREIREEAIQPGVKVRDILGIPTDTDNIGEAVYRSLRDSVLAKGMASSVLDEFPTFYEELFSSYSSDIQVLPEKSGAGKVGESAMQAVEWTYDKANTLNKLQEFWVRSQEFTRALQIRLAGHGESLQKMIEEGRVREIPPADLKHAVQEALRATFAMKPDQNTLFGKMVDMYESKVPALLAPMLVTFPRFAYNATNFISDYAPVIGLAKAGMKHKEVGGTYWEGFKGVNSRDVAKQLVGTSLFLAALGLVRALGDDDDWYLLRVPGYTIDGKPAHIDIRGYQPFAAFVFMANKVNRAIEGKPIFSDPDKAFWEVAEATLGLSQRNIAENKLLAALWSGAKGATGLGDDKEWERVSYLMQQQLGEVAGGFLRPLKTVKDLVAQFDSWTGRNVENATPDLIDRPKSQGIARSLPFSNTLLGAEPRKDFVTGKTSLQPAPGLKVLGVTITNPDFQEPPPSTALVKIRELDESFSKRDVLPAAQRERATKGSLWRAIREAGPDVEKQKVVIDALKRAEETGALREGQVKYIQKGIGLTELQSRLKQTEWKNVLQTLQVATKEEIESVKPILQEKIDNSRAKPPTDEEAEQLALFGIAPGAPKRLKSLKKLEGLKSLSK